MTLKLEHVRRDRWEARLSWVDGRRGQLIGWTADAEDLVDRVLAEVIERCPTSLLIDVTERGNALYATFRGRLQGVVVVGRLTV